MLFLGHKLKYFNFRLFFITDYKQFIEQLRKGRICWAWWRTSLILALGRQRQVRGQPGLQSEFQDSQGYTEKPCLENQTNKQTKNPKTKNQKTVRIYVPACMEITHSKMVQIFFQNEVGS
jgi:ABC-type phosphate/phosphonate transport system substrate-binding protein